MKNSKIFWTCAGIALILVVISLTAIVIMGGSFTVKKTNGNWELTVNKIEKDLARADVAAENMMTMVEDSDMSVAKKREFEKEFIQSKLAIDNTKIHLRKSDN